MTVLPASCAGLVRRPWRGRGPPAGDGGGFPSARRATIWQQRSSGENRRTSTISSTRNYGRLCRPPSSTGTDVDGGLPARPAEQMMEDILRMTKDTGGGMDISHKDRESVDSMIEQLGVIGDKQVPRPLQNPLIYGNYEVSYVSSGPSQTGAPAGGRFRGALGRTIFQTRGVFQSVLEPDIVTNKVEFALLGFIKGSVGLRGRLEEVGDNGDTVKVYFEPPQIDLGGLRLAIGPESNVQLSTTYLDEQVRLGKGSRGSLFVFVRGGAADDAAMDMVGLQKTPVGSLLAAVAVLAGAMGIAALLWISGSLPARITSAALGALCIAITGIVVRGGIQDDRGA